MQCALGAVALLVLLGGHAASAVAPAVDVDDPPGGNVPTGTVPVGAAPAATAPSSGAGDGTPTGTIFLTFDDGPYAPWTQQMLDVLADYHAHATFFMVGRQAAADPEMVEKVHAGGHGLGNHGYNHANLTGVSQQFFNAEVGDTGEALGEGNSMCLRPPYGAIDYNVVDYAEQLGYSVVKWNMDPQDWNGHAADEIAAHVIDNVFDGAIVVMHDGGGDRDQTVKAVRTILKTLTAQGWQFKALCRDYPMLDLTTADLATPTPDPNATATPTQTPAPTATATPTPSPTLASTPTATRPASQTPTRTPVPTATSSAAATTATPALTATMPSTPTLVPTSAATATATATATARATLAQRATASAPAIQPADDVVYGQITFPIPGVAVSGAVLVQGFADHPDFVQWRLDLLVDGEDAITLATGTEPLPTVARLAVWNSSQYANGPHMLRLRIDFADHHFVEYFTHVTVTN